MIHFGWAIATFIAGGSLGVFISALCSVSAKAEKEAEKDAMEVLEK